MGKLGVFASDTKKRQFLNRLQGELAKRGVIDVLRNGVKVYPADLIMFYLTPTENNAMQKKMFDKNIFSVTRQLRYSQDAAKLALDLCIFINGLPVITMELKNQLTKQNTENAVQQYMDDRDPHDLLFSFKRCMVHFAVDDAMIKFCTKLAKKDSWFLPFNKGYQDGAGNPPNPDGLMTDYLWKDILTKKEKQLARKSALTYKVQENALLVVEDFTFDAPKTKDFIAFTQGLGVADKKVLVALSAVDKNMYLSARNIQSAKVCTASQLNTYGVLDAGVLVVTESALKDIDAVLNS